MKLSNIARSLSEIGPQASLFIPMTMPSAPLPNYVMVDPRSSWHVSGLLSTALESMSLPSRLRIRNGSRQLMDGLISALNINGNQNIAKLRMSVDQAAAQNGNRRPGRLRVQTESRDLRVRSHERSVHDSQVDEEPELTTFDMDFFPAETGEQNRGRRSSKKTHVFGQAESYRVGEDTESKGTNGEDEGYERARRRATGLPLIQKSVRILSLHLHSRIEQADHQTISGFLHLHGLLLTRIIAYRAYRTTTSLLFPLLDSFPHIFAHTNMTPSLAISTSLSSDTTVASRVKNLQYIVSRAVGITEREALSNSLGEIAEAYEEGWDSGSDGDED
jgi:hypothetical protein